MTSILAGAMLLHLVCLTLAAPEVFYGQKDVPQYYYGTLKDDNLERVPLKKHDVSNAAIPRSFDARENWAHCPSIREIRNQGACGSCWAVAAAETMTDRLCIYSNGSQVFHFSSEHILTCCPKEKCCGPDGCCEGGYPLSAWEMFVENGVVSGGEYRSHKGCQPYEIPLRGYTVPTPRCQHECESGYNRRYEEDLHYGNRLYRLQGERDMQVEMMYHGPIQVWFDVYKDFGYWNGHGVYEHVQAFAGEEPVGGHSVKLIGWGEEQDGTPFWLVANSYGRQFGEGGFFKFLRGSNHCKIEEGVVAGIPRV